MLFSDNYHEEHIASEKNNNSYNYNYYTLQGRNMKGFKVHVVEA